MQEKFQLENGEYTVEVNGIKHWYKVAGVDNKTVPIIIIHGGPGGNNYVFERTIGPYLERFATIIYYEQRGCGRSDAPDDDGDYTVELLIDDLKEICKFLKLKVFIPLGYSFGAELALEFSLKHPDMIDKIICQAPSNFSDKRANAEIQAQGFLNVSVDTIKDEIEKIMESSISSEEKCALIWNIVDVQTVDRLLFHNKKYAKINRSMWEESNIFNTGLMAKAFSENMKEMKTLNRFAIIEKETQIMIGKHDRNTGLKLSIELSHVLANNKIVIFEYSAHFPDIEESHKYSQEVRKFLNL